MGRPLGGGSGRAATTPPAQSGRPESLPAWRTKPARRSARRDGSQREPFQLYPAPFSPDGHRYLVLYDVNSVGIMNAETGQRIFRLADLSFAARAM